LIRNRNIFPESLMDEPRIDAIATRWSLVRHPGPGHAPESTAEARKLLVLRYAAAIRRYVGAMVRDDEQAAELSQDVVVRLMRGDFAGADPEKGRFRDLLKVAIRNMVRNHWQRSARDRRHEANLELVTDDALEEQEREWTAAWQRSVIQHAWARIDEADRRPAAGGKANSPMDVLKLRIEHPDASTAELANLLSARWKTEVKPDNCRQLLSRARKRFAAVLIDEVRSGLDDESDDRLQEELAALKLLEWIGDSGDA
jgi:RNA polymerase sigma factor (sigma-70 family)